MATKEPFNTQFNMWWVLSAALVVIVLVAGIFIGIFVGRDTDSSGQSEEAPGTSGSATEAAPPANSGACDVPSDDQDYPVEAPDTKWELYKNVVSLPTSETYGPTKREGDFWQCYAHSPKGALFAAFNLSQAFTTGGVYDAAVDTPEAKQIFEEEANTDSSSSVLPELAGFKIDSYSESAATISLLFKSGDMNGNATVELIWDDEAGDWRWDAQNSPEPEPVEDTDQYTMWGPRNG